MRSLAIAVAAAVLFLFVLRPGKPAGPGIQGRWGKEGVDKPNVIIVTMDTTRADHLACYGYPGVRTPTLDALAARGVLFEQCAAASPLTLPSHATIMTGMYPTYHGVRINGNTAVSEAQTTLAEIFSGRGYDTGAFIAAFVLDGRWGLNQGFKHYDDSFDLKKYKQLDLGGVQKPGNEILDEALAWLEQEKDRPFFAWIHLYDPHTPYEPPEPFRSEYGGQGKGPRASMTGRSPSWIPRSAGYRNGSRPTGWTGRRSSSSSATTAKASGATARGRTGISSTIMPSTCRSSSSRRSGTCRAIRVAAQSRTADVFPTVLELAGIPLPGKVNGHSQVPAMLDSKGAPQFPAYSESMAPNLQFGWSPLHSLRTPAFKFIDAPRPELYDLANDPGEERTSRTGLPDRALAMKKELDGLMTETSAGAPTPQAAEPRQGDHRAAGRPRIRGRARPGQDRRREGTGHPGRPQGQAPGLPGRDVGRRDDHAGEVCRGRRAARAGPARGAEHSPGPPPPCDGLYGAGELREGQGHGSTSS